MIGLAVTAGCVTAPKATTTTRDSLGIQVVGNQAPVQPDAPWILDSLPLVDLGGQSGDPTQEFSESVYPVRLSDGRLVVANFGANELRFFGPDGKWLKTVGRKGGGPGEFQQLGWLDLAAGDTLRAYDWDLRRISVFTGAGALQRVVTLSVGNGAAPPLPVGMLGNGRLIALGQSFTTPGSRPGAGRDTMPLQAYDAGGALRDSLGRLPGSEHLIQTSKQSVSVTRLPFGKDLTVVARRERIYVGTADGPEVTILKPDGKPEMIIRWAARPVPVTAVDIEGFIAGFGSGWKPGQEAMRDRFIQMVRQAPFPKWKPAYAGLMVAADGSIWVRRYSEPDKTAPTVFDVFDAVGRWLGAVRMPAQFSPTQIGDGVVVGTWKDEDDLHHVQVYRLASLGKRG